MACLDMYNPEHKTGRHHNHNHDHHDYHHNHHHFAPTVSPRISFSNDFVDAQQALKQEMMRRSSSEQAPVSSDFEFSVSKFSMMSGADELFFKGRLLPYKDNNNNKNNTTPSSHRVTTLREELLAEDEDDGDVTFRPAKTTTRWRSLLGLKRAHIGSNSKKAHEKSNDQETHVSKTSQEVLNEGSTSCRDDVEIGI